MHPGRGPGLTSRRLGQRGGVETVTLTEAQMPNHTHTLQAGNLPLGGVQAPSNTRSLNRSGRGNAYQSNSTSNLVDMADQALPATGGSQAHNNMQPFLTMNFIIALVGLYPSRG